MRETEGATRDPRVFTALRSTISDLQSFTPTELQLLARTYLAPDKAIPVVILPEGAAANAAAAGAATVR
jgi:zinc protease